jgi:hypothetical protein
MDLEAELNSDLLSPQSILSHEHKFETANFLPSHIVQVGKNVTIFYLTDAEKKIAKTFKTHSLEPYTVFGNLPFTPPCYAIKRPFCISKSDIHIIVHHKVTASGRHNYDGEKIPLPFNSC